MSLNTDRFTTETLSRNGSAVLDDPADREPRHGASAPLPRHTPRRPKLGRYALFILVVMGIAFVVGILPRLQKRAEVEAQTRELSIPAVTLVSPAPAKAPPPLLLSGELKAYIEAPLYARATGYVHEWYVDIGAHVEAGQVMAQLDIPDLDQQLSQARADLDHAQSALALAEITARRWKQMLASKAISTQEADEKLADVDLDRAAVGSAKANVDRITQLVGFAKITAPFSGTVTARTLDIGQLVNAGSGQELFRVARTDKLRVFVRTPQNYALSVKPGQTAELTIPEIPGRVFPGKVVRTAGAMDAASRTLLTEVEVDNSKQELLAGSYAMVRLSDARAEASMTVPANTLLFRPDGPVLAVVGEGNRVNLHHVKLGRDFGPVIEIVAGLEQSDRVVINPPDSLVDGIQVRIAEAKKQS